MSWWLSVRNWYGLLMGTSTDFMKPRRPEWPTHWYKADENLQILLGGTGNCGLLIDGDRSLLINCNSGEGTRELLQKTQESSLLSLIATSTLHDYVGGISSFDFDQVYASEPFVPVKNEVNWQPVSQPTEFAWGNERVIIEPVETAFTQSDLVVYLANRKVLFLGGLFYNKIHPILDEKRGLDIKEWRDELQRLMKKYPAEMVVPHEGDLCKAQEVLHFCDYLETLSDPENEFSYCRQNFDWHEIPGYTSLEENFDLIRKRCSQ